MKGSLRHDGLSRLQSTDDLRLVVDRDASFHLTSLELRCGTTDENHVLSFHLLQRAFRYCKHLFAEFGWKLNIGEHIRLEAQVMIGYFAANTSRSCLRIKHIADVGHFAFKALVRVG